MFEFVYKMFGEGHATLPKSGIEAIPMQLLENLKTTKFKYNTKVETLKETEIILTNGTCIESDYTIIASEASELVPNLNSQSINWKSCVTLYFETETRVINKQLIGLISKPGSLVNNIFYNSSLKTRSKPARELLSVTVIDTQSLSHEALVLAVKEELLSYCGIKTIKLIEIYDVPKALPKLDNLKYDMIPSETRLTNSLFLAGDTQLNGSLNAAIISGECAALGVIEAITGSY